MERSHATTGRKFEANNTMNQCLSPKDERIVSANPSPDAAITGPSRDVRDQPASSDAGADINTMYPFNAYASLEQPYFYGGYDGSISSWGGYPPYASADGLQVVPPVIYSDNPSLGLRPSYEFNSQMAYGQYSPVTAPLRPVMVDNQLFSSQQVPFSPTFYPQPVAGSLPHMSATPVSQTELTPKGHLSVDSGHNTGFYNLHGILGFGEPLSNRSNPADLGLRTISPVASIAAYTQPVGTFGSYDFNMGQISPQRPLPGFGLVSNFVSGHYPYGSAHQSSNFGNPPSSIPGINYRYQLSLEKGRNQKELDSVFITSDRNRGPRALKTKGKSTTECSLPSLTGKTSASASGVNLDSYNRPDFRTDNENAKFFVIKSFSEDNVHRSIKYGVWASTPHGNSKLDAAYHEAKEKGNCPVFLFFSVNASAQFCGLAEMVGPVDFENSANYWQQDRWSGQFPVRWHIIKDVPNSKFRHILLENNDNKPVTHSRDSQEVKLEQGVEMLRIFKDHEANTCIIDDFDFYDERERVLKDKKTRQLARSTTDGPGTLADSLVSDMSDRLNQALRLEGSSKEAVATDKEQ
ncbi:hypothetical protein Nepgr_013618 [Nepenthes gracilis]|uniref:YTH domain-containing family protein n=1 Tax=Nepenthes gracilis TaxID=150966 RepID=A0AAD3SJK9_NEPGR|nr:hypothetical protein Nepgr_013618 [Nepenthes gracilis]